MMLDAPDEKLAAALTDVRRAFRLLWAFQRRVLDYNKIAYERLAFTEWAPSSLLGTAARTGNASWTHLPMADMEFRAFRRHSDEEYSTGKRWEEFPRANDAVLYMRMRADTGMPLIVRNDPSPLTFEAAERCQTKLLMFIVLNRIDRDQPAPMWAASDACRAILVCQEKATEHPTITGYSIFGQDVDLAALPDEGNLVRWIDDFKRAAESALGVNFSDLPSSGW